MQRKTPNTGHYSPLRYPGGKGKRARFMANVVEHNALADGRYVEPFAGGAGIAWELLLTGAVSRVLVNDINEQLTAFWTSVLESTEKLTQMIADAPLTIDEWHRQKAVYECPRQHSTLDLGFACFYLNRTNRSGILTAGVIGGQGQAGKYKMDARFPHRTLIDRIHSIAERKEAIEIANEDALEFLRFRSFKGDDLIYADPPYYEKGRLLYHDAYSTEDHRRLARVLRELDTHKWIVSYDEVDAIRNLYDFAECQSYELPYSASLYNRRGTELMFYSRKLKMPSSDLPVDGNE